MGYAYGFHLVLVKPPKEVAQAAVTFVEGDQSGDFPIETYAKKVVAFCRKYHEEQNYETVDFYFPELGEEDYGGSGSYGCGDQNDGLRKTMAIIGKQFPDAVFALHYYYWDMTQLEVYTFQGDQILDQTKVDFENYRVGPHQICIRIKFMDVSMDGNMSMLFNKEYGYGFDFKYERIYELAGIPVPDRQNNNLVTGVIPAQLILPPPEFTAEQLSAMFQRAQIPIQPALK